MRKLYAALILFQLSNAVFGQMATYTYATPGNYSFMVPCSVTSITVECWGAGGGGGAGYSFTNAVGGGGGGGAYSKGTFTVVPGDVFSLEVGAGGTSTGTGNGTAGQSSWFSSASTIMALGGNGGVRSNSVAPGAGAAAFFTGNINTGTATADFYGGGGGTGNGTISGGGGGSAGTLMNGFSGLLGAGGAAVLGGGAGATGVTGATAGNAGGNPGGGGSGGKSNGISTNKGGDGGAGKVVITITGFTTYCIPNFVSTEPITSVVFAGINNTTSASTSSPGYEFFCSPAATVIRGSSGNTISLKGNTNGNFTDHFTVFLDWDQNGVFGNNVDEIYSAGSVTSSTGTDAFVANTNLTVPATATLGYTMLRVVKSANAITTDPCNPGAPEGQAEDYRVLVLDCTPGTWKGLSTDWFDPLNWCGGVPTAATDAIIPNGVPFYPEIITGTAIARNINLQSAATITLGAAGRLQLHGSTSGIGTIDAALSTIELAGAGSQLRGANLLNNALANLSISATSSIAGGATNVVRITGNLRFNSSGNIFTTNGNLVLASTASGTASVRNIDKDEANANISGNSISGNASVERFLQDGRKWRFLCVNTIGAETVRASWMENQTTPANRGIWITDPSGTANGFDAASPGATMKYWNGSDYTNITDPSTFDLKSQSAYMTFVRGDRTCTGANATLAATVLRSFGSLAQNNYPAMPIDIPVLGEMVAVANPYASAIDLSMVNWGAAIGQPIEVSVWDPFLGGGSYGLGAFQTLTRDVNGDFRISPGGGSYTSSGSGDVMNIIESGQAFFIQSGSNSNSIQFSEASKADGAHLVSFTGNNAAQNIFGRLYMNDNGARKLADGFAVLTDQSYSTEATRDDARKRANTGENISVRKGAALHAADLRGLINNTDSIFINLANMRVNSYRWEIDMRNLGAPGRTALLIDRFLLSETILNPEGVTAYDFQVTSTAGTFAPDRFMIVFRPSGVLSLPTSTTGPTRNNIPLNSSIVISPNPVENKTVKFRFTKQEKGAYHITITDNAGRNVHTGRVMIQSDLQTVSVPLPAAASGTFRATISDLKRSTKIQHTFVVPPK